MPDRRRADSPKWIQQHIAAGRVADVATGRRHDSGERNAEVQARVESLAIVLGAGYIWDACQRSAQGGDKGTARATANVTGTFHDVHDIRRPMSVTAAGRVPSVSNRDFRFACPRWPLYTPEGRPAPETLVRHSIVPLQRPSAQPVVTCGRLEALFSRHFSDTAPHLGHFFANRTALPVPRVSLPAPAAPRSSATCRRTAVGSDALPPARASSTWHASPAGLRFSPAAAGDS